MIKMLLFISIYIFSYITIRYVNKNSIIKNTSVKIFNLSELRYEERKEKKEQKRLLEGNVRDEKTMDKVDLLIERSYIKDKIPFINAEIYIVGNIILITLAFILGYIFTNWVIATIISMLVFIINYSVLYFYSGFCYEKIDKDLLTFLNIMENYSGSNDDIVSILGKTYPYLHYPLNKHIENFYSEATSTGDITRAFRKLEYKIENEKARDIIRNLEICSRHEANYQEIIKDNRETIMDYMKSKEKRKSIISNGRIEILGMLGICILMVSITSSFVKDMFQNLLNNTTGNIILLYCIAITGLTLWNFISFDNE